MMCVTMMVVMMIRGWTNSFDSSTTGFTQHKEKQQLHPVRLTRSLNLLESHPFSHQHFQKGTAHPF